MKKSKAPKHEDLKDLFSELKTEYLESFPEKLQAIEKLWQAKNRRELEDEFHKIKGTGTTYGVKEVSDVAEIMESLCYHGHPQLGFAVMISLELLKRVCDLYVLGTPYDLHKDKLFQTIRKLQAAIDAA